MPEIRAPRPLTTKRPHLYKAFGVWVTACGPKCTPEYWALAQKAHEWARQTWLKENPPIKHD
jgi:hypothetical protein